MKLLSLKLENFRCFERCAIDLNVDGLIGVVGPNGAGKSSLFGAVEWAFYGSQRGPASLPAVRDGANNCRVELEFALDDHHYRLWRTRTNAELRLSDSDVVLATGTTATSAAVAATLGMSRDAFLSTFYARQREVQALDARGDPGRRRAQLERLLGIERLRHACELARAQTQEQRLLVRALDEQHADVEEALRELREREDEAREKAPAVDAAREALTRAQAAREQARAILADLRSRAEAGRARQAEAALAQAAAAQATEEARRAEEELARANTAQARLEELAPVAARQAELAARERELELARQAHERASALREQWQLAQTAAATAADQLAAAPDQSSTLSELSQRAEMLRGQIEAATSDLLIVLDQQTALEQRERTAGEQLAVSQRAAELDHALRELPALEETAEQAAAALIQLRAANSELPRRLEEEPEHLTAVQRDGADAACPRCKRAYGNDYGTILDRLTDEVSALTGQTVSIESELAAAEQARRAADSALHTLRVSESERASLTTVVDPAQLEQQLATLRERLTACAARRVALEAQRRELQPQLDELAARLTSLGEQEAERLARVQRLNEAQTQAQFLDEQLATIGSDGYHPDQHAEVRQLLAAAEQAARESASLSALVEQRPVLERRRERAATQASEAVAESARLTAEAIEAAVEPDMVEIGEEKDRESEAASQAALQALHAAEQEATREDAAVQAAREKLAQAQEQTRRLKAQRRELLYREVVQAALEDYRADASRRALPNLEQETASLLAALTRGRYGDARLSDSYSLELQDGGQAHALRRFSGGEQDVANLALRLALSRALARQRGIEAGFIILDEILGSQDVDRRAAIMGELRELLRDFRQVFVVSHFDDIADECDLHIKVSRSGEIADALLVR